MPWNPRENLNIRQDRDSLASRSGDDSSRPRLFPILHRKPKPRSGLSRLTAVSRPLSSRNKHPFDELPSRRVAPNPFLRKNLKQGTDSSVGRLTSTPEDRSKVGEDNTETITIDRGRNKDGVTSDQSCFTEPSTPRPSGMTEDLQGKEQGNNSEDGKSAELRTEAECMETMGTIRQSWSWKRSDFKAMVIDKGTTKVTAEKLRKGKDL